VEIVVQQSVTLKYVTLLQSNSCINKTRHFAPVSNMMSAITWGWRRCSEPLRQPIACEETLCRQVVMLNLGARKR